MADARRSSGGALRAGAALLLACLGPAGAHGAAALQGVPAAQDGADAAEGGVTYPWRLIAVDALYGHLMDGPFKQVSGVHYDPAADELLVCDEKNGLIGIFDAEGTPLFAFGGPGTLLDPRWVHSDAEGTITVLDGDRAGLKVYSYRGEPIETLAFEAPPAAGAERPEPVRIAACARDAAGAYYVGAADDPQLLVYEPDGALRWALRPAKGVADFQVISGIAVGPGGLIAVVDLKATPVQLFAPDGRRLAAFGTREVGAENFSAPVAVAFDDQAYVHVVDLLRHDVKVFDRQGRFQTLYGGWFAPETRGRTAGEMLYPSCIAIAPGEQGRIYVGERFGNRVQVFQPTARPKEDGRPRLRLPDIGRIREGR